MTESSLSEYAGWLYGQPGIQPLLLSLQDDAGLDVLLLLSACWLGQRQAVVSASGWEELAAIQQPWREAVIEPLRQVRRYLAEDSAARALYERVKATELAAEWEQLGRLEYIGKTWALTSGGRADLLDEQLKACCLAQQVQAKEGVGQLARLTRMASLTR